MGRMLCLMVLTAVVPPDTNICSTGLNATLFLSALYIGVLSRLLFNKMCSIALKKIDSYWLRRFLGPSAQPALALPYIFTIIFKK
jgi:hypothetical protein